MRKYGIGVDIGGTTCKLGIFETNGSLIEKWEIPTNVEEKGSHILDDLSNAIKEKLLSKNIMWSDIEGVGLGIPGPVTQDGIVHKCVNLGWGVVHIQEEMQNKLNLPVKAGNDANLAALGEMWQGSGKGYKNLIMVTLGTGVGAGIIYDGKIISGTQGAAGEIGHIKVKNNETISCGCGKKGCLEQYASATGIVNRAYSQLKINDQVTSLRELKEITAKDIFDAAKKGDKVACNLIEELGELLGTTLANVSCVLNPEIILLGGGLSKAGDILVGITQKHFLKKAFHICENTKFSLATLGNDAGIYGGVCYILNR